MPAAVWKCSCEVGGAGGWLGESEDRVLKRGCGWGNTSVIMGVVELYFTWGGGG